MIRSEDLSVSEPSADQGDCAFLQLRRHNGSVESRMKYKAKKYYILSQKNGREYLVVALDKKKIQFMPSYSCLVLPR